MEWQDVRRIIREVDDIYLVKGRKVIHIELKDGEQEPEMLARLLLRPSCSGSAGHGESVPPLR